MKVKTTLFSLSLALGVVVAHAATVQVRTMTFKQPITQYKLMNTSRYTIECAQMIGGYCANNPMPQGTALQFLPDPGSDMMRGHIMVMDPDVGGHYVDNIIIVLKKDGSQWQLTQYDLYNKFDLDSLKVSNASAK